MEKEISAQIKGLVEFFATSNDDTWSLDALVDYCKSVKELIRHEYTERNSGAWRKFFVGRNPGPSLGMGLSAWKKETRQSFDEYVEIVQKYAEKAQLSRDDYLAFRKEFFEKCGSRPKVVLNRVVGLMFPDQFIQVPNEEDTSTAFNGLDHLGAFAAKDKPNAKEGLDNDVEAKWFDENTAIMNVLKEVSRCSELEEVCCLGKIGWKIVCLFKASPSSGHKAVVKYGPPGTGKTYGAKLESEAMLNSWRVLCGKKASLNPQEHIQTIQFHPSMGYEDFIEGLRPFPVSQKGLETSYPLRLVNGSFKEFCRRAGRWEIDLALWAKQVNTTVGELLTMPFDVFRNKYLSPANKLFDADHWKMISGAKPLREGCTLAEVLPPYVFIIDEINRADLSRVFGELMFCVENRGPDYAVLTQYAMLNDKETGMINVGEKNGVVDWRFFVPSNVHIVGTMNVIDRSVESFDFALRRRFVWERDEPDLSVLEMFVENLGKCRGWNDKRTQEVSEYLVDGLSALNSAIEKNPSLGTDWEIGHAYFKGIERMDVGRPNQQSKTIAKEIAESIWGRSIRPLLEEYLRGGSDVEKKLGDLHDRFLMKQKREKPVE